MAFDLVGKTFLVTGASSGIGRGIAVYYSQLGAQVILVGRNQQRLDETLSLMASHERNHRSFNCDLTDMNSLVAMMNEVYEQVGPLDGFVHSAGIGKTIALRSIKEDYLDELHQIHVKCSQFLLKMISKPKRFNPGCSCILIGSAAGVVGHPGHVSYASVKAAMHHLTKSAALELLNRRIRVNCLAPGMIHTPMTVMSDELLDPARRKFEWGQPEDVAHAAAFLSSDLARMINGVILPIDAGFCAGS